MLTECEVNGKEESPSPPSPPPAAESSPNKDEQVQESDSIAALRTQYEAEVDRLQKEVKLATKAKETIVMRYANSEKEVLRQRKEMENADKQVKNLMKETEALNKKNKMLSSERERLIHMVDAKVCEVQNLQKECDRLKDDISSKDFKIKWTQNKLNTESDTHKETQQKLEKTIEELREALDEARRMRQDCQDMIAESNEGLKDRLLIDENGKSPSPTAESSEGPVEVEENTVQLNPFQKEIETLKQKHRALIDENNSLSCRVQNLQQERLEMEQKMILLQESNAVNLHQIASLQSDLAAADSLRIQLCKEQERVSSLQRECDQLRKCNSELLADMATCRAKEAELLQYTQQVTEKNVLLQSGYSTVEARASLLEEDNRQLLLKQEELQNEIKKYQKLISQEKKCLGHEKHSLLSEIAKQGEALKALQRELDEAKGETMVMRKRHEASMRELTKELKVAMSLAKEGNNSGDGMSQSSRTSSSTSLNNLETANHKQRASAEANSHGTTSDSEVPVIPDQQILVERIVKLQRMLAKKQDKIEFLNEHAKQLIDALQKKSKIIQCYAMCQDPGALSSDISDQNKAELVKHGGIMASVYASKASDDGLTLDLSLEINRKLQSVLEDTLLKNITLKDNLSTLGLEISRLTEINRKLKDKLEGETPT